MLTDQEACVFNSIYNFVKELDILFTNEQHSLKLYNHLLSKTKLSHTDPIRKHISGFRDFCIVNRDGIKEMNHSLFVTSSVVYSDNVFIDMKHIFSISEPHNIPIIYKHLLVLSALLDPTGNAKDILKQLKESESCGKESDLLKNLISKIEDNMDPNAPPAASIASVLQSGVFTDMMTGLTSGMSDGSLDMSKMFGVIQSVMSGMGDEGGGGDMSGILNMMGPMLSNLTQQSSNSTQQNSNSTLQNSNSQQGNDMIGMLMSGFQNSNSAIDPNVIGMIMTGLSKPDASVIINEIDDKASNYRNSRIDTID
jgi:hypothetical protein